MSVFKEKKGFFGNLGARIHDTIFAKMEVDEDVMDNLEEILITSDIGMETTMKIMDKIRDKIATDYIVKPENVRKALSEIIRQCVDKGDRQLLTEKTPLVVLMIGINGGGKTTTIGKLAHRLKTQGKSVMLAAADTFRAAASEQLSIWGERNGIPVIKHQEGADPSAVIFDAIQSAKARGTDVLICDTAGRLQNKKNLMNELEKMNKVISREWPEAARETLLILDATTGKNAISQAQEFGNVADITGIVITKLDGTAKGGIAITIADEFDMPVKFIGTGEGIEDLEVFDPAEFIGGLFDE
ncbi:MAG: signal recognition particle-docking protein FtsY [Firmicutes bacterium]|nr:signal recognition particle-docking protein FtsY [Bacillota bacterium]MBR3183638.1 signal recognition particle-docking protein FtsY [Bacillota bacterium]MBR3375599.1 signal recognition particle-docking protein FtsY [Bacillota bacterium]MBR4024671.1 signal recognition particle-docking protein FtsY [Bacillota bacterium]MBR6225064.1 signal recognition particle-docking protein FtsY [Bacillota bacterium]